jgi:hypothetical protein
VLACAPQGVILGEECARAKPFPDPYLEGLKVLGLEPQQVVVFEDSPAGEGLLLERIGVLEHKCLGINHTCRALSSVSVSVWTGDVCVAFSMCTLVWLLSACAGLLHSIAEPWGMPVMPGCAYQSALTPVGPYAVAGACSGLRAAAAAGIPAVGITSGHPPEVLLAAGACATAADFAEVLQWVHAAGAAADGGSSSNGSAARQKGEVQGVQLVASCKAVDGQ